MNDQQTEALIKERGADVAPRLTAEKIEAVIVGEHYFTADEGKVGSFVAERAARGHGCFPGDLPAQDAALRLLTFCVLVLRNGFTVTGESACASPANFNAEIGRKLARDKAIEKMWALEGYLLKQMLHVAAIEAAAA